MSETGIVIIGTIAIFQILDEDVDDEDDEQDRERSAATAVRTPPSQRTPPADVIDVQVPADDRCDALARLARMR